MSKEKYYQANQVVSCGEEEDGAILYNPDTDSSSIVNLSGRQLWDFLKIPHTVGEIVEHLIQSYNNVSAEQAFEDADLFIKTLVPDFLLEIDNDNL